MLDADPRCRRVVHRISTMYGLMRRSSPGTACVAVVGRGPRRPSRAQEDARRRALFVAQTRAPRCATLAPRPRARAGSRDRASQPRRGEVRGRVERCRRCNARCEPRARLRQNADRGASRDEIAKNSSGSLPPGATRPIPVTATRFIGRYDPVRAAGVSRSAIN
jgi:hypothetical protein